MRRTSAAKESQVIELIAKAEPYANISAQTSVPVSTIKKIKKRNAKEIELIEVITAESIPRQFELIRAKATYLLLERLKSSESNQIKVDELNELYEANKLSEREYLKRKRFFKVLSTRQLALIANSIDKQLHKFE